jgi:hypothetical protein
MIIHSVLTFWQVFDSIIFDDLVKSLKMRFPVIPANPGSGPGQAAESRVLKQL